MLIQQKLDLIEVTIENIKNMYAEEDILIQNIKCIGKVAGMNLVDTFLIDIDTSDNGYNYNKQIESLGSNLDEESYMFILFHMGMKGVDTERYPDFASNISFRELFGKILCKHTIKFFRNEEECEDYKINKNREIDEYKKNFKR